MRIFSLAKRLWNAVAKVCCLPTDDNHESTNDADHTGGIEMQTVLYGAESDKFTTISEPEFKRIIQLLDLSQDILDKIFDLIILDHTTVKETITYETYHPSSGSKDYKKTFKICSTYRDTPFSLPISTAGLLGTKFISHALKQYIFQTGNLQSLQHLDKIIDIYANKNPSLTFQPILHIIVNAQTICKRAISVEFSSVEEKVFIEARRVTDYILDTAVALSRFSSTCLVIFNIQRVAERWEDLRAARVDTYLTQHVVAFDWTRFFDCCPVEDDETGAMMDINMALILGIRRMTACSRRVERWLEENGLHAS